MLLSVRRAFAVYPRRIAPQRLQVVTFAHVLAHDVDDHVEVVQHHPRRLQRAVDGAGRTSYSSRSWSVISSTIARRCGSLVPEAMTK